jgi:hypothetical protein
MINLTNYIPGSLFCQESKELIYWIHGTDLWYLLLYSWDVVEYGLSGTMVTPGLFRGGIKILKIRRG